MMWRRWMRVDIVSIILLLCGISGLYSLDYVLGGVGKQASVLIGFQN